MRAFKSLSVLALCRYNSPMLVSTSAKSQLLCFALLALAVLTASGEATNPPSAVPRWGESFLNRPHDWYHFAEARRVADVVLQYQSAQGAWPKNTDLTVPPTTEHLAKVRAKGYDNTIDNKATTMPMRFLALMTQATKDARYKDAFTRGLDYLFAAQYTNGGWPQFYPLRDQGYYSRITYNDNAMVNVMFLLRDVAAGEAPYGFVDAERRLQAQAAEGRGIDCILKTQLKHGGKLTAWCAQYDEHTLEPAWARNFEPPSLSGEESVGIVRCLMQIAAPPPEVCAAIEGAVAWFKAVQIPGMRYQRGTAADGKRDGRLEPDPKAGPIWARFYEIGSNRPVFTGRDKQIHYSYQEVERERRGGYDYYGTWPEKLLAIEYPRWAAKLKRTDKSL
jgi:PelA/Pel-15E family pectate lyase